MKRNGIICAIIALAFSLMSCERKKDATPEVGSYVSQVFFEVTNNSDLTATIVFTAPSGRADCALFNINPHSTESRKWDELSRSSGMNPTEDVYVTIQVLDTLTWVDHTIFEQGLHLMSYYRYIFTIDKTATWCEWHFQL